MAKLVTKFNYLKASDRNTIGNYVRYIATRSGVEKIDESKKFAPETKKQSEFIKQMLIDFPDAKESIEYQDYIKNRNRGNASELISRTLEDNMFEIKGSKTYADYIATRPRAERFGSHGLFTNDGVKIKLSKVSEELNNFQGNVYTVIISLRREDAERLGFNNGKRWRDMLRTQVPQLSESLKIPMENLNWYAAFHNETHHPHIHLIAYSSKTNQGYLNKKGVEAMRSSLAKSIFEQDLISVYEKQTTDRDELRQTSREIVQQLVAQINSGMCDNPQIEMLLTSLAERLSKTKGKKVYGYLSPAIKNIIDEIVCELEKDERISSLYNLWYESRYEVLKTYSDTLPEKIPLSQNKEFKPIKNMIITEALNIIADSEVIDSEPMDIDVPDEETESDVPELSAEYLSLLASARKGNHWSQYKLARYLLDKDNSEFSPDDAVMWFEKSAKKGNDVAMYQLGKIFLNGIHQGKNIEKTAEWLERAIVKGNEYAEYLLGNILLKGEDLPKDIVRAVDLLLSSAEKGNKYAAYTIGKLFFDGTEIEKDTENGLKFITESADKNFVYAEYYLGKILYRGTDTPRDLEKAIEYLKKAASKENSNAAYLLGKIYSSEPTKLDMRKAIEFYSLAGEKGNIFAYYQLGKLYYYGTDGIAKDYQAAIAYLKYVAEQGNEYAEQMLYNIHKQRDSYFATGTISFLHHISNLVKKQNDNRQKKPQTVDRKERKKIDEKKRAHGLKISM